MCIYVAAASCRDAGLKEIQVNFALRETQLWRKKQSGRQLGLLIFFKCFL